jgi:hypothetical protein
MNMTKVIALLLLTVAISASEERLVPIAGSAVDAAVIKLREGEPQRLTVKIEWRKFDGSSDNSDWHLSDTEWWVRLHPDINGDPMNRLDKNKKYVIDGVLLEEGYNAVHVWVYDMQIEGSD